MFGNTQIARELEQLKLRLFGHGNTRCLNVSTSDYTNSILGGHRKRIKELEEVIYLLNKKVDALINPVKRGRGRPRKK